MSDKPNHVITLFRGSICGALMWAAVASLHQDMLGKDAYIQLVQDHWVDASVTVPIAIAMLALVGAICCVDVVRLMRKGAP